MAEEYLLSKTASEVEAAINKALKSVQTINGLTPDASGNIVIRVSGGSVATIGQVTLLGSKWVGDASPYSQVVQIEGVTENSQVDLTPSVEQLVIFYEKDLTFVTENEGGTVTVYAIGQKPEHDYTIQVTITEVQL